jgi:hypothetical protein
MFKLVLTALAFVVGATVGALCVTIRQYRQELVDFYGDAEKGAEGS